MLNLVPMDILGGVGSFLVSIASWVLAIVAIVIVILAIIFIIKPDAGISIVGSLLKADLKILSVSGKLFWRGRKVFLVLVVFVALFLTVMFVLPANSWSLNARLLLALVFASTATATITAAVKGKRNLATKLLGLTISLTAGSFLVIALLPSVVTATGGVDLALLGCIGGAAVISSVAMVAYLRHKSRLAKEDSEEALRQELELSDNKEPLVSVEKKSLCLRVVRIPENYMKYLKEHAESQLTALRNPSYASLANTESHIFSGVPQFQGLLKTLAGGGIRVAQRTDFDHGKVTTSFFTEPEHLLKLKRVLEAHIPGLELKVEPVINHNHDSPLDGGAIVVRLDDGIPNSPTPLSPVHDFFIQNGLSGTVYICIDTHGNVREAFSNTLMNYSYKQIKKREKEEGNAINYYDEQKMQRIRKTLEEGRLRVGIYAALYADGRDSNPSLGALESVLASGFSSNNGSRSARVSVQAPGTIKKLLGVHAGANLEFTTPEAAAVLQIQTPVETSGFSVTKTADFAVKSPGRGGKNDLWLGWLIRRGKLLREKVYLDLESLNLHGVVGGSTGSGKSIFLQELIWELWKKGIAVVVIEPVKREYRRLGYIFPVNIFTMCNENVSPFRLNPLEIPEGLTLDSHISSLVSIFRYAFGMEDPLPEIFRQSLIECYKNAGWSSTDNNVRGFTPCLLNFLDTLRQFASRATYEDKLRMNIQTAGVTRIGDLTAGSMGAMMLGYETTPFSVLKERPTIIELDAVGDNEKTLVASLILLWIYNNLRAEGESKKLKMVVIVEEAHRIAEDKKLPPSAYGQSRESLSNLIVSRLLKEGRSYGLGVILADQNPVGLSEDAIKNTNLKVLFSLPDVNDRRRLGESIGLNAEQIEAMTHQGRGQAVLWTQGSNPAQFQGRDIEKEMEEEGLSTAYPKDQEVAQHMAPFFKKNPLLRMIHPHVLSNPSEIYLPPPPAASGGNKSSPKNGDRAPDEIQAHCERMCAKPQWKAEFGSITTEKERENYIRLAAQRIADHYKIQGIEPIVKTFQEITKNNNNDDEDGENKHELG